MNEGTWSLDALYLGFDDPKYAQDFAALQQACAETVELAAKIDALSPEELVKGYLQCAEKVGLLSALVGMFANLRRSANTKDTEAATWAGRLGETMSTIAGANAALMAAVAKVENIEEILEANPELKPYAYRLQVIRENDRYALSAKEEAVFARMGNTGATAWVNMRNQLTATMKVSYNGSMVGLSTIRNLAYDADPAVRKAAYEAELAAYPQVADAVAYSLNSIKGQVIAECSMRGFESPLAQALHNSHMTRPTLDALLGAMQDYMPKFWSYLRRKAEVLGHKDGLPWYDLFAPMGAATDKVYSIEEARDFLLEQFGKFDDSLKDMVARAFAENWIDFYPRDGKVGGAFCLPLIPLRQSRVLTNYDGSFSDIVTIAHELGHGYHNEQIFDQPIIYRYTSPVAETASTFNEHLVMNAAIAAATDKQEKLALIESRLQDTTQIICDIYSRFLFEDDVFASRPKQFMNAAQLCEKMLNAQKKAYGTGLDHNVLHPYAWVNKSHYYSADNSYYNYPYAFGSLFAGGLYAMYQEEGKSFIPRYQEMLHLTPACSVEDAAKVVGIDLTKRDFWEQALASVADEIDGFLALTEE